MMTSHYWQLGFPFHFPVMFCNLHRWYRCTEHRTVQIPLVTRPRTVPKTLFLAFGCELSSRYSHLQHAVTRENPGRLRRMKDNFTPPRGMTRPVRCEGARDDQPRRSCICHVGVCDQVPLPGFQSNGGEHCTILIKRRRR